jgi:hypothetical protein
MGWCRVCQFIGADNATVNACFKMETFSAAPRPNLVLVRVGTLDDRELVRPVARIWTVQAPTWACLDERLPKIERQPPPAA